MVTLTPNLKLRVDSSLTSDSKLNLHKLDNLGSLYQVNSNAVARVRSKTDIVLQPQDPDIGGTGSGGTISFGTTDQPASSISLNATSISTSSPLSSSSSISTSGSFILNNGGFDISITAPSLTSGYSLTLPDSDGTSNQVLSTDGDGSLSWVSLSGVNIGQELKATWSSGDGLTKTINHGFGTRSIMVQVLDSTDDYRTVEVDGSTRPTDNTVVLESSIIPTNWLVLLKEIP